MSKIRESRIIEGARVCFTTPDAAAAYGMPADTVGTVVGWVYADRGEKRIVVDCDVSTKLHIAWVRPEHLMVDMPLQQGNRV